MQYEDRVAIPTPEGVEIELTLAGLGSRLSARLLDLGLQLLLAFAAVLVIGLILLGISDDELLAFGAAGGFALFVVLAYDVYFEVYRQGQTPGKRKLGIRVTGDRGEPVSFRAALARNVMRLIDELATIGIAGIVSIARSERNQRLGDMTAGTLVSFVSAGGAVASGGELSVSLGVLPVLERAQGWDVSAIDAEEVETIRRFLGRRFSLQARARAELAARLAARLRPRVVGADPELSDEWLLEVIAALKARR